MMSERKARWRDNVRNLYAANKYWFWGSTIFFLLAASVYLIFTPVTYKVAAKIIVKSSQDPKEIIRDVKSDVLLKKVIHKLPLQVVYYQKEANTQTEISGKALPIRFVSAENSSIKASAELKIFIVNNQGYKILKDRVFMYVLFGEPVNYYSFAKFTIVKGPGFKIKNEPIVIRVYSENTLLKRYGEQLDAKFSGGDKKSIELSLTGNSLQKGKDFLNKLVEIYNLANPVVALQNAPAYANPNSIEKIRDELAALQLKATKFKNRQSGLVNDADNTTEPLKRVHDKVSLNLLNAIQPYVDRSVNQFVLIPYGDEVKDEKLKNLIAGYNSAQAEKQHLQQLSQVDNSQIEALNKRLSTTNQLIASRIAADKNELAGIQQSSSNKTLAALEDSISKTNALLAAKQLDYQKLASVDAKNGKQLSVQLQEPYIEKSTEHVITYPKIGYVYLFAFLIGITLPLVIPYFKIRVNV